MIRLLLLLLMLFSASAGPRELLNQGDQLAQTLLNQMDQKKASTGAHPFYHGIPKESNFSIDDLSGRAQGAAMRDPAGQMIFQGAQSHAQMKIDPQKDPLLAGSQKVMDNPLEMIGGKGTHVIEVQQGGRTENIVCEESGEDSLETCTRTLKVTVRKTKIKKEWTGQFHYWKEFDSEKEGHHLACSELRQSTRSTHRRNSGDITAAYKACMQELGQRLRGGYVVLPSLPFEASKITEVNVKRATIKPARGKFSKSSPPSKIKFLTVCGGYAVNHKSSYDCKPRIIITYEEDSYEVLPDEWSDNCARLEERVDQGLCGYHSRVCTQGRQTRVIEGVPITRDCWQETLTYHCSYPAKDDCSPLRARGCAQIHSACKQQLGNACVVYQQTYQCKDAARTTHQITGGDTPFCMDGNCRDQSWELNDELMSSVAHLSILKEMQGNLENGFLFTGKPGKCSKYTASFKDCCGSGKGWGKDLGLGHCHKHEKELNTKRKAGLCHYVGTYCAEKGPFGICLEKESGYCCFGSKLLKAFQEQGRTQIGMGWGEPKSPLCRGFTIAEIQRIDFSKLDLREVFEELMKNYKPGKIQGQDKKLEQGMNVSNIHQQDVFDNARHKYAPPPPEQNMSQKVGERLEVIKRGMSPNAGGRQ